MTDRDDALTDHPGLASRRAVLLGAGAVGAAGILAACGDDAPPAAPQTTAPETTAPQATAPGSAPAEEDPPATSPWRTCRSAAA